MIMMMMLGVHFTKLQVTRVIWQHCQKRLRYWSDQCCVKWAVDIFVCYRELVWLSAVPLLDDWPDLKNLSLVYQPISDRTGIVCLYNTRPNSLMRLWKGTIERSEIYNFDDCRLLLAHYF
jgi:hypothetical protein